MPRLYIITAAVAAVATWILLFPARAVLRRAGVVDKPNARSSHQVPTIRGGGVAIVAVIAGVLALLSCSELVVARGADGVRQVSWSLIESFNLRLGVLLLAFVTLAVVSFLDDLKGLKASVRFAVQLGCAVAAVVCLLPNNLELITINSATVCLALVAVLWISGYTNAFNFMDGIDGIAGMQALVTGLGTAVVALRLDVPPTDALVILAAVAAGAALGFLPHNFPRARVFMGDVSSAPLGFLLAALAFWVAERSGWWALFWIGLLHANFVLDTGITLIRRALRGDRLHEAHREHFYQRLIRSGATHAQVTLAEAALQVAVAGLVVVATPSTVGPRVLVGAVVVTVWCAFFGYAERRFRHFTRAQAQANSAGLPAAK